jgi:hypothetical protein
MAVEFGRWKFPARNHFGCANGRRLEQPPPASVTACRSEEGHQEQNYSRLTRPRSRSVCSPPRSGQAQVAGDGENKLRHMDPSPESLPYGDQLGVLDTSSRKPPEGADALLQLIDFVEGLSRLPTIQPVGATMLRQLPHYRGRPRQTSFDPRFQSTLRSPQEFCPSFPAGRMWP